jgi:3-oxoacyl-[acyl-carrier-protein] synthase-3
VILAGDQVARAGAQCELGSVAEQLNAEVAVTPDARDLPEKVVPNEFFAPGAGARRGMFTAPTTRRHVARDETAAEMIAKASERLLAKLRLDPVRDIDILFTNVAVPVPDIIKEACAAAG